MLGLLLENGPLHITEDGSLAPNNYSWDKLVDYVWVDQPVYVEFHPQYLSYPNETLVSPDSEEPGIRLRNQMVDTVRRALDILIYVLIIFV